MTLILNGTLVSAYHNNGLSLGRRNFVSSSFSSSSTHRTGIGAQEKGDGFGSSSRNVDAKGTHMSVNSEEANLSSGSDTLQERSGLSQTDIDINVRTNSKGASKAQGSVSTVETQTCVNCTCGKANERSEDKIGRNGNGKVVKNLTLGLILPMIAVLQEPSMAWSTAQEALDILHGTQPHTDSTIVWFALFLGYYLAQEQIMKKIASF